MHWREPDILWTTPAQDRFIDDFHPTPADMTEISNTVKRVRNDPPGDDGKSAPLPIDKDSLPELRDVESDVFLCRAGKWFVYYTVLPTVSHIVFVDDRLRA
jgi:hypothetical protein